MTEAEQPSARPIVPPVPRDNLTTAPLSIRPRAPNARNAAVVSPPPTSANVTSPGRPTSTHYRNHTPSATPGSAPAVRLRISPRGVTAALTSTNSTTNTSTRNPSVAKSLSPNKECVICRDSKPAVEYVRSKPLFSLFSRKFWQFGRVFRFNYLNS